MVCEYPQTESPELLHIAIQSIKKLLDGSESTLTAGHLKCALHHLEKIQQPDVIRRFRFKLKEFDAVIWDEKFIYETCKFVVGISKTGSWEPIPNAYYVLVKNVKIYLKQGDLLILDGKRVVYVLTGEEQKKPFQVEEIL